MYLPTISSGRPWPQVGYGHQHRRHRVFVQCLWKSILGVFEPLFDDFLLRSGSKNIVKYNVFVLLAYRNYILQHGENCLNTRVYKHCEYRDFCYQKQKHRKYPGWSKTHLGDDFCTHLGRHFEMWASTFRVNSIGYRPLR